VSQSFLYAINVEDFGTYGRIMSQKPLENFCHNLVSETLASDEVHI